MESEIAVYLLAQKLGVPCCPAYRVDRDTMFSAFEYDYSKEYIVHFRSLFDGPRSDNEYRNLLAVRPRYGDEIERMILFDFITRQDDRHTSNIAIKISGGDAPSSCTAQPSANRTRESFYALYDNGRSLFYEDSEETVQQAVENPAAYATSFGYSGTYWDYVQEIAARRGGIKCLLNLEITEREISEILREADFSGYRLNGAAQWIIKAIDMIKALQ